MLGRRRVYAGIYKYDDNELVCKEEPFVIAANDLLDQLRESQEEACIPRDGVWRIEKLLDESDTNLTILDISQRIPKS
ncbi:MAG: hypothetical protein ACLUPK_08405 [Veillonella sp.]